MGEIQPSPGEKTRHRGWDKEPRATGALSCLPSERKPARRTTSQVGSDRAGFPEALGLTPLPPGSGISGVRAEGQLHPLLPSGSGIPPANVGGGAAAAASDSVQVGLPLDWESGSSSPPPPTQAPKAGPQPSSLPPAWAGMVCARRWQKTNPPGWVCRERGNLDTVAVVVNGRHTRRLFWGDCCRC